VCAGAGIDPLGAVAGPEIAVEDQPRDPFRPRLADFLGGAGTGAGPEDHQIARRARRIDGGHGDDMGVAPFPVGRVAGKPQPGSSRQIRARHIASGVMTVAQRRDTRGIDAEPGTARSCPMATDGGSAA